jgi:hypothetical protein
MIDEIVHICVNIWLITLLACTGLTLVAVTFLSIFEIYSILKEYFKLQKK